VNIEEHVSAPMTATKGWARPSGKVKLSLM
jgi:hypothetical protein